MTRWEKEILRAILALEEEAAKKLKAAYDKALKQACYAVSLLALSEIMEKLNREQAGGVPGYLNVYQKRYQTEISKAVSEPFEQLEAEENEIMEESLQKYFLVGAIATMYSLHKQKVPLVIPVQAKRNASQKAGSSGGVSITFTGPKVAEWYKYTRRDIGSLKVDTVADIQRAISQGKTYNEIARSLANSMANGAGATPFKKAYNKAMTIVRTEGGRINNEAQYQAMLAAKEKGASIQKQWCAALDQRTRPSHARVDGEVREVEELFSNGLLYPCQKGGAAEEVINCRCVALARATWGLGNSELDTLKDRASYFGLDKTRSFDDFKSKYMGASEGA